MSTDTPVDDPRAALPPIEERGAVDAATFATEVAPRYRPLVLRGQVASWASVAAAGGGDRAVAAYLHGLGGGGRPLDVLVGAPDIRGRFFYRGDALEGFNFNRERASLDQLLGELLRLAQMPEGERHTLYANAATAPEHLPGWSRDNALGLPVGDATPRLWIGNGSHTATHYDGSTNLACVVAGRRRFTLFPPDQIANLYVGPLDRTLAGPPASMVDPTAPDLVRYPRFAAALAQAQSAELGPGDAVFIPALWWHHVQAFGTLNVLCNYWWAFDGATSAFHAMVHAMMAVRDRPAAEKAAWRAWFDHFVFDEGADRVGDHLPESARGVMGPASERRTEQIRAYLLGVLQRR
ncbi:cupin-like domain-containing protein [Sphingomonas sp. A2-49]|uniref:cupin-like domain-containing protein n=1 Tax=Sphingomonas sp. A2-49 TaxID=1391375 RepID=UPI0021CE7A06|nr:cupin-like domain-containing protein [Sphingomonas sp. A2-49]MCU6453730.1 cupin-like domain-containing protein [Sphingomonas sp. A2-49]